MAPIERAPVLMAGAALLLALLALPCSSAETVFSLDSLPWTLTNGNGSISLSTSVPAYPLEVLRANGVIDNPLYGYGELTNRWVALDQWTFAVNFSGSDPAVRQLLDSRQVLLRLGGLDTFADVQLNGRYLLSANNFHREWIVPVNGLLVDTTNELVVSIRPAMQESLRLKAESPYPIPSIAQMGAIGAYTFVRKPASDLGWDWGPAYAASGIHGSVELLGFDHAHITSSWTSQEKVGDSFTLRISTELNVPFGGDRGTLTVAVPELGLRQQHALDVPAGGGAEGTTATFVTEFSVNSSSVELWWPAGYGKQRLYDVAIDYAPASAGCPIGPAAAPPKLSEELVHVEPVAPQQPGNSPAAATPAGGYGGYGAAARPGGYGGGGAADAAAADAAAADAPAAGLDDHLLDQVLASAEADAGADAAAAPSRGAGARAEAAPAGAEDACAAAAPTSSRRHRVGFRTVQLVRLPIREAVADLFPAGQAGWDVNSSYGVTKDYWDGSWALSKSKGTWQHFPRPGDQADIEGESFYFKVNGVPIFMKGANLVPMNVLPTNVTEQTVADILDYSQQSNFNMIRVWGGGMYPVPALLDQADERGILIWMETMFACAPYPRDPDFLDNVAAEVEQQVRRISWHPSVAIWGGNNEIEGSLNWYAESRTNKQLYAGDYIALFVDTIRAVVRKTVPGVPFVDSSPSNGAVVDNDRQYVKRWGDDWDPRYGDVHHYAYESDCEDWSTYPKSKFISEFGSQSYPTFATLAAVTDPADWRMDSDQLAYRNRRFGNGLEMFQAQFKRHFRLPDSWTAPEDPDESYSLFRSFLFISHMQQARCYEAAINYWRRLRAQPAGLTMGVLYWQLNDIAEYASWSAYDYGGRWKPLAYAIRRMFEPLQVQAITDGPQTKIFLVNDHASAVPTNVTVRLLSLEDTASGACGKGGGVAASSEVASFTTSVAPLFAQQVWSMATEELLARRPGCTQTTCYVQVTAAAAPAGAGEQDVVSEAQLLFVPPKDINLPDPQLSLSGFRVAEELRPAPGAPAPIAFTLSASAPAVLTNLLTDVRGRFSDDAVTVLHPCAPKEVTFFPHSSAGPLDADQLAASLTVQSLFDHQFGRAAPGDPNDAAPLKPSSSRHRR